jgi:hypothetical protein
MGKIRHFRQLEAWQEAHKLVLIVYQVTKGFPGDERFGLVSQMRRAAVSSPAPNAVNKILPNPYSLLPCPSKNLPVNA